MSEKKSSAVQQTTAQTTAQTIQPLALAIDDATITALDNAAKYGASAMALADRFRAMFMVGASIQQIQAILTPKVMAIPMAMQNTALGFLTDRKNGGYSMDEVRGALIEAAIKGLDFVGNKFNIIAGRMYITKEGFHYLLSELHKNRGLLFHVTPGVPKSAGDKGAIVPVHIEWTYNGETRTQDLELPVRLNASMGVDALKGKATRKAYAWLYEEVTGNAYADGDATDGEMVDITPRKSPLEAAPAKPQPAPAETVADAQPAQSKQKNQELDYGDLYDLEEDDLK